MNKSEKSIELFNLKVDIDKLRRKPQIKENVKELDICLRHKELLEQGVEVRRTTRSFIVCEKFVVDLVENRWRKFGKKLPVYWFTSIPDFVNKYVRENQQSVFHAKVKKPSREIKSRNEKSSHLSQAEKGIFDAILNELPAVFTSNDFMHCYREKYISGVLYEHRLINGLLSIHLKRHPMVKSISSKRWEKLQKEPLPVSLEEPFVKNEVPPIPITHLNETECIEFLKSKGYEIYKLIRI